VRKTVGMNIVNPRLNDYLLAHSSAPDPLLRELGEETRAALPDAAEMQITHDEGVFLTLLVQMIGARNAVEVGVFTGYSSICIARGLPADGHLLACDVSDEWTSVARRYWKRAALSDRIELKLGPAIESLRALPADPVIDFAFIDADKPGYPLYYEELVTRLRPGGLIVLDNVLREGRVIEPDAQSPGDIAIRQINDTVAADERVDTVMLPLRDGVTIARRRG
jgi:caffeoyl-CoA O-methyltransferase